MKIFITFAIAQLFLLATGNDAPGERKLVGCLYMGYTRETSPNLFPKDIDPSICTHLVHLNGRINEETEEIEVRTFIPSLENDPEGLVPKFRRLKEANPDLKLILQFIVPPLSWMLTNSTRRANVIRKSVAWLKGSGFDGLDFPSRKSSPDTEEIADFFCDLKAEFNKHGYILVSSLLDNLLPGPSQQQKDSFKRMVSCCDQIVLETSLDEPDGYRFSGLNVTRSRVDKFIESGVPANKIQITVAAIGTIFMIVPLNETEVMVNITGPDSSTFNLKGGISIFHKELLPRINNSSLGWTYRREETKEPYAFTETGVWITYEDIASMEFKAHYALEKGLGGINIFGLDLEDAEGIEGHGRFPFTRTIYNTFRREGQSSHTSHN